MIINALTGAAKMERLALAKSLLCFGVDGVSTFQGPKTGVTQQIQNKYVPFALVCIVWPIAANLPSKPCLNLTS